MKTTKNKLDIVDELAVAEASAWLVRLQDTASAANHAAFKEWLNANPVHAQAFARVNDIWEVIPGAVARRQAPKVVHHHRTRTWRGSWAWAYGSACAALLLVAAGALYMLQPAGPVIYETATGQQKTIVLADNTRIALNTDSRLVVEYQKNERRVQLQYGEALFHVTKNANRPFVVETGGQRIVDLGTIFNVRHYSRQVAVTLLEGKVMVGKIGGPKRNLIALDPGERLTVSADGTQVTDHPNVENVTAWRNGRVYFNDTTLGHAVAELNRYSDTRLVVTDPTLGSLRISGVFSTHDPKQFAEAAASLNDLHVEYGHNTIVLKR